MAHETAPPPRRRLQGAPFLLALALGLGAGAGAGAQVAPGPLAAAHGDLEGPALCFRCHARGGGMTARCLACHTEIAARRSAGRGLHGRSAGRGECASCHPDHAGRDFALVRWEGDSAERFDHRLAGWQLSGKHATAACRDCHQPKFQHPASARGMRVKDPARSWLGLDAACLSCHEDPHAARFGADCMKCHDTADWHRMRADGFDHEQTRYPLRGAHARVACATCHDPQTAWGKTPSFATCGSCHRDAHAGQATVTGKIADCAACHTVEGFRPSSFTVAAHRATRYPLAGRHAEIACERCHARRGPSAALGSSGVVLRPAHEVCASCHADAHGGQLAGRPDHGACEACHRVQGFVPSTLPLSRHASTRLPLDGRHAEIACGACHGAQRGGLPVPAGAAQAGSARFVFRLADVECAGCHRDPHQGRYDPRGIHPVAGGCSSCHDARAFRPARVDSTQHANLGFALEGAHRAVPCVDCHGDLLSRAKVTSLTLAAPAAGASPTHPVPATAATAECLSCHTNPHGNQFSSRKDRGACTGCHGLDVFRPASRFAHDRDTSFPLAGAHARVPCTSCHRPQPGNATVRVVYRGLDRRCESCHGNREVSHDQRVH